MSIAVLGVSGSRKTPGVYMNSIIGGPGTSAGVAPTVCLLLGSMLVADLTGSAPSFTTTAGTYLVAGAISEKPVQVFSADDAKTKFGQGSELHLGARAFFAQFPDGTLYCCPVAESAGSRGTATITFVGAATSNGTLRLWIQEQPIEVAITSGDAIATMSAAVATAVAIQNPDLHCTAQFALGVATFTSKQTGPRANNITVRAEWVNGTNTIPIGTSTAQFGTAATISGSKFTGGTTQDTVANALTSIAAFPVDMIAMASVDTTNINRVADDLATKAGPTLMYWGQAIAAVTTSPSTTTTQAALINSTRVQLVCAENSGSLSIEIAAQVMAARLNGDALVGGFHVGEDVDPAANLNGMLLKSIKAPSNIDDIATATEVESMLANGTTPLVPSPEHPGYMKMIASYTTKHKDGTGFTYAASKTKVVTVTDFVAATMRARYLNKYFLAGFKLKADAADGSPVKIDRVVTPGIVRDDSIELLRQHEANGIIANVDDFLPQLKFEIDTNNRSRINAEIPAFPIPDLDIIAANVRQVSL